MVLAKGLKSRNRVLDHGDVVGLQDGLDDGKDGAGVYREVAGDFLDERGEDMQGDLDISKRSARHFS